MSEVVTGDAVVLGLRPARLPSRALALLIDLVVVWTVYLLVLLGLAFATAALDEAAVMAVSIASFLLVLVGGPVAVETLSHGRSLGKMACGLRVVRDDGGPIRFRHALVRGLVGVVEILMSFGVIACVASLVSARGRRVGDVFAGTLVVRERVPVGRTAPVPLPPPWLVGRFAQVDLSAVPDGLWLGIRQCLTRMRELDPEAGRALAERLAGELAVCTGAAVPPGVPAAVFLAAVVHERQARDARRAGPLSTGAGGVGGFGGVDGASVPTGRAGTVGMTGSTGVGEAAGGSGPAGVVASGAGAHGTRAAAEADEGLGRGAATGFAPPA
ncbi:RDD family protein [Streptomyces sudanensis]|uniref:RDD family protein n=1 Tax=Streptomyces sudanensis TaxID=436397 RepID=UPI0020CC1ED2|nr:RDD family protein [Streptomyces sudanensis]MCP9987851.1 RDD family protein [Streptomyces sudanensis]